MDPLQALQSQWNSSSRYSSGNYQSSSSYGYRVNAASTRLSGISMSPFSQKKTGFTITPPSSPTPLTTSAPPPPLMQGQTEVQRILSQDPHSKPFIQPGSMDIMDLSPKVSLEREPVRPFDLHATSTLSRPAYELSPELPTRAPPTLVTDAPPMHTDLGTYTDVGDYRTPVEETPVETLLNEDIRPQELLPPAATDNVEYLPQPAEDVNPVPLEEVQEPPQLSMELEPISKVEPTPLVEPTHEEVLAPVVHTLGQPQIVEGYVFVIE
eukprot:gnl/Dysnectes_brevis/4208_a5562_862.p1 GENE.gnl/Dysnectes_brevis/4208_a5562_862~~gnl/Dysnectes_brevis/4208_a5562_862.p1  ORF type:complete len:267 (-),score=99.78 gnl/Dysnectes_brevis/4208_a5562_862:45-845(-)